MVGVDGTHQSSVPYQGLGLTPRRPVYNFDDLITASGNDVFAYKLHTSDPSAVRLDGSNDRTRI